MRACFGLFTFDTDTHRLEQAGRYIHLTPKAFELLALLIDEAPRVVSKAELHERLWPGAFVTDATLVGVVKEVRRALGDQRRAALIRTAHRVGYAFSGKVETGGSGTVIESTHWIVHGASRIPLREGVNAIGRDPGSTVWLDVAGVSRRHARIVISAGAATLEDLGSKNGTLRGDQLVTAPVTLRDADRIQIASVVLVFRSASSGMSTETLMQKRPEQG